MTVRFGVIGLGAIGSVHASNLASRIPGATLAAVADVDIALAQATAHRFGVPTVLTSATDLIADPAVDAVVICTPRDTHAPLVIEAAAAGKHTFCEKPLACTRGEIAAVDRALAASGILLQVGFNRRFDANFIRVKDAITSGEIGATQLMHLVSRDPQPAAGAADRTPADILLETTIHDLDAARHFANSEIASVYTVRVRAHDGERLDGVLLTLQFANGIVATIDNHLRSAFGYDQRVEVFGSAGAIAIANETATRTTLSTRTGLIDPLPLDFFTERYAAAYIAEMRALTECITTGHRPAVSAADGAAATIAALAAIQSLDSGQPVTVEAAP